MIKICAFFFDIIIMPSFQGCVIGSTIYIKIWNVHLDIVLCHHLKTAGIARDALICKESLPLSCWWPCKQKMWTCPFRPHYCATIIVLRRVLSYLGDLGIFSTVLMDLIKIKIQAFPFRYYNVVIKKL